MTVHRLRLHGRGGQGSVTAAKNLAPALYRAGRNVQAIPSFGVERRGAPVEAYVKFTDTIDEVIPTRTYVHEPEYLLILDDSLIDSTEAEPVDRGLPADATVVVNTVNPPASLPFDVDTVATVDAARVAEEHLGKRHLVNTVMLGSFAAATDVVAFEHIAEAIRERFPQRRREINVIAARDGFERTRVARGR